MKKYVIISIVLLPVVLLMCSCGKREQTFSQPIPTTASTATDYTPAVAAGEELLCLCNSREKAEDIAGLYGIELVDFSYGVATFHAEGDLSALINQGKANGWPELGFNGTDYTLH